MNELTPTTEKDLSGSTSIGGVPHSRRLLEDGEGILKITAYDKCHYLWNFYLFSTIFCKTSLVHLPY